MNRDFLLRLAERVREMIRCACTNVAKEQLQVWAEEFEIAATELETGRSRSATGKQLRLTS